ncbi:MAG TPA: hypothetical protein PKN32_09735 [Bacteroidales bacterium]|nr:hypothetical protein [Bacteroidales bacterium]
MENKKEIDIISLIIWVMNFIKRYLLILIISVVVGAGIGLIDYFFGKNYYDTKFIASSPVINNQIVYELVEPIKYFVNNEMYDSVSVKLDVSIDIAKNIRKIELDTSISQAVVFNLQLYNMDNTVEIKNGLVNYINSIPYIKSSIETRRKELEKYLKDLNAEIDELNKLQNTILQKAESNSGINLSMDNMFNEMMLLYDRKLLLQTEYNSLQSFKVINNNMIFTADNSLLKSLFVYSFLGLFLGLILCTIIEVKRQIKLKTKEV